MLSHSNCNKHCGFTVRLRCWQNDYSGSINHAVTMCVMTDVFLLFRYELRERMRLRKWKGSEELISLKASPPASLPHFQPLYVMGWPPPTELLTPLDPHPCGLSRLSENTGRLHAGCLMERRRVCEVHWPIHIAPHALVLQNSLTYHM